MKKASFVGRSSNFETLWGNKMSLFYAGCLVFKTGNAKLQEVNDWGPVGWLRVNALGRRLTGPSTEYLSVLHLPRNHRT